MALKVLDLFCGTGAFSKGFENDGRFEVVFGLDVLPVAVETFRANHTSALAFCADIRRLPPTVVGEQVRASPGDIDVVIGGPPCQGFSSIRPHRSSGSDDQRNSLFKDFATYVEHFRPRAFVMENVVGLVTYKDGDTLDRIQATFASFGYTTDWRVLNAAHFGVPQKRERLVMVGVERGATPCFPAPTHRGVFKTIGLRDHSRMLLPSEPTLFDLGEQGGNGGTDLPNPVTVGEAIDDLPRIQSGETAYAYDQAPRTEYQRARRERVGSALKLHDSTAHTERMLEIIRHAGPNISHIPVHLINSGFSSCYSRVASDEPCVTITVNFVHPASNRCIHPWLDRALTRREGARIQSFDDDFLFAGNKTKIAKQIGNAVPPLLGRAVAGPLGDLLGAARARS